MALRYDHHASTPLSTDHLRREIRKTRGVQQVQYMPIPGHLAGIQSKDWSEIPCNRRAEEGNSLLQMPANEHRQAHSPLPAPLLRSTAPGAVKTDASINRA